MLNSDAILNFTCILFEFFPCFIFICKKGSLLRLKENNVKKNWTKKNSRWMKKITNEKNKKWNLLEFSL